MDAELPHVRLELERISGSDPWVAVNITVNSGAGTNIVTLGYWAGLIMRYPHILQGCHDIWADNYDPITMTDIVNEADDKLSTTLPIASCVSTAYCTKAGHPVNIAFVFGLGVAINAIIGNH